MWGCVSAAAVAQETHHVPTVVPFSAADTQEFDETVVPITELSVRVTYLHTEMDAKFGTGFCLDPACRFIGTNYHLAAAAQPHKIKGQRVIQRYLASGPDDDGATVKYALGVKMKYTLSRDLAIFELLRPLRRHHGVGFSLAELQVGQRVDIYAYPKESINPVRKLLRFTGSFKGDTTTGLLAFDYKLSDGKPIRGGASGGIVVDARTHQIVGILNEVSSSGEAIAAAVPIRALADFVRNVQPFLAEKIFPSADKNSLGADRIAPFSEDIYPEFIPPASDVFQHRPEEPYEVTKLRTKAQNVAYGMRNLIAVQRLAWGSGNEEPTVQAAYEVRIIDGDQLFREYPGGKKELEDIPFPALKDVIVPGGEWSELPELVGTELRLKVRQAAEVIVNERKIKVFQYYGSVEDGVCLFRSVLDLMLFKITKSYTVSCHGEVWTDEDTNIIRMSKHYKFPGKAEDYHVVVTYGWLKRADEPIRLIPLTISSQSVNKKRTLWCRGQFTDYQVFTSRVRITADDRGSH
jgi:hypothetical protein